MLVAWRADTTGETPASETGSVLELIPKQRSMVDLVDRVAS
jgi:hypothetical protein